MTTSVEDRIRDAFEAQSERTTINPNAEFLDRRAAHTDDADRSTRHWRRTFAAAAALVALGGVALGVRQRTFNAATERDIEPVSIVANPPTMIGLPFEVAIGELPEGWTYVDISESGDVLGAPSTDVRVSDEAWFLFRNPATGAAITISSRPDAQPADEYYDVAEAIASSRNVLYALDGEEIWFRAAGIDAASATEIANNLILTRRDGFVDVEIDPSTGFELEWSRFGPTRIERPSGSGQIALRTPNGTATIDFDTDDVDNPIWSHFGVASTVGTTTVYTSEGGTDGDYGVTGDPIDGEVLAAVYVSDVADVGAAQEVFASLRRFDDGAVSDTAMTWDEIADQIAADVSALPVSARIDLADVVVTEHRDDTMIGACATWHGVTRCRSSRSPWWNSAGGSRFVDVVVDGLWVVIGRVDAGVPIETPTNGPGAGTAIGVWRPVSDGAVAAYAVPSATAFELEFDSYRISATTGHDRPIR